jgi:hypothetical protein
MITNLENGRRSIVTIDEVLVLAYVLEVAPIDLFLPPAGEKLSVTSEREFDLGMAALWATGDLPVVVHSGDAPPWSGPQEGVKAVRLNRRLQEAIGNTVGRDHDRYERDLELLAQILNVMAESGIPPYTTPPAETLEEMRRRRLLKRPDDVPLQEVDDGR